ncbi:MAG: hypothetical protein ACRDLB_02875 [Actinomycetota bacterium]
MEGSSARAALVLIKQGWDARALAGGFNAWRERYPVDEVTAEVI